MLIGVFLLSAATLALEIALTRVFSLTQWYHFAFMAVDLALLGFGASGSLLAAIGPGDGRRRGRRAAGGFVLSALLVHPACNLIPFDAYRLAIEPAQVAYLLLYVVALSLPFLCCGLALAALLASFPRRTGAIYGANLLGSGAGCLLALALLPATSDGGLPFIVAALGMLALTAFAWQERRKPLLTAAGGLAALLLAAAALQPPALFTVRLSPYKALSIVSAFRDSRHVLSLYNAFSRVDVVEGPAVRSAPGLSLAFAGEAPAQPGVTVDGDGLRTIPTAAPAAAESAYADYLPVSVPLRLRPAARVLVLQAGPGQDVLAAWRSGAHSVTAVEANPLVVQAARAMGAGVYDAPTRVLTDNGRAYLARSAEQFDVIIVGLAESHRAVTAGDFSLSESYVYTVEAFAAFYEHLAPGGLLVVTRWAQSPPSEDVRVAALAAAALRRVGDAQPDRCVAAYRSLQTLTLLLRRGPFTAGELAGLRDVWRALSYDAVYFPGMTADEANQFVVLPDTLHHDTFAALLRGGPLPPQSFDISPTTDDRPFFFHFFNWSQTGAVLRNMGKAWQPFGGAGFLALAALLAVAVVASAVLIVAPLLLRRRRIEHSRAAGRWLVYVALLGIGFLFVEIPLIQRYILFLGQPVYATAIVISSLLTASGAGSLVSARLGARGSAAVLVAAGLALAYPSLLGVLFAAAMALPFTLRLAVAVISLAPLGFVLGMPFPWGLRCMEETSPGLAPWAWAVNGCASVIASVLAPMLALSAGFSAVLTAAALAYAAAWIVCRSCAPAISCAILSARAGDDDSHGQPAGR